MSNFKHIQVKLKDFSRKYYINELIKGALLFFSTGFLYLLLTLFIEYFLWLKPLGRTFLFWIFIIVELGLFSRYILFPLIKIVGLRKGINEFEASRIIGNHFPEVKDKLLNMLQLQNSKEYSELVEASIEQKSKELQPIPFKKAIDFSKNKRFVKYTIIPVIVFLLIYVTGNIPVFNDSLSRVVQHKTEFEPPAPFSFKVLNSSFNIVEGDPFTLQVETVGNSIPEDVAIYFLNENYYLENKGFGIFEYTFSSINTSFDFYLQSNKVISKQYKINSIKTPIIINLKMVLNYPDYTDKTNELIQNTGNTIVPQGTKVSWQIETAKTTGVSFNYDQEETENFLHSTKDYFSFSKELLKSINYTIATSNKELKEYESLNFAIQVVSDEYPKIDVKSDIDSIAHGPVQFIGQLSDDYGIRKLQLVYYDTQNKKNLNIHKIDVSKTSFTDFYYVFPDGVLMDEGVSYEMYFEVFDNDAVKGSKKTKSRIFSYYNKTKGELKEEQLKEQNTTLKNISKSLENSKKENLTIGKFKNAIQKKAAINWNDTKKLEAFLKRQNQYQEMFQKQTNQLQQNLNEQTEVDELKVKKEQLQQRIEETKKLAKQEKLLKELEELTNKLSKEEMLEKLKELTQKNKQNEQSLERILELTKRFYIEQKTHQISDDLKKLGNDEKELANKPVEENSSEKQEKINKEFDKIKKNLQELNKQNSELKRPMKIPDSKDETNEIEKELKKASDELKQQQPSKAKKSQKSASKKMMKLGKSMEQSMMKMEGESIDENIEDLRKVVENLIEFSFQQETLLDAFSIADNNHASYPKNIRQQHVLKEYFEHIDDSLYVLSLRLVRMGASIQKEVSNAHYFLDESLLNFTENRFNQGISNQQFVITAANNLANSLSDLLESLMNASPSFGKGKGNSNQFSLPTIIKKQGELIDQMKKGLKKGTSQKGNGEEQMNGDLYEIYKQQSQLRQLLNELLGKNTEKPGNGSNDVVKKMEQLEKELLERGFSQDIIQKMQQLNYELLKLEKATLEQGEDLQRKSESNKLEFQYRAIDKLKLQNQYFNYNEILNRQSLPLRTIYKKKVQEYFKTAQ